MTIMGAVLALTACDDTNDDAPPLGDAGLAGMNGDEAGSAGNAGVDCSSVANEEGEPVTIRVVNDTASALHLGEETQTCELSLGWRFELRDAAGRRLSHVGNCRTCRDATVNGVGGCPSVCLTQPSLTLEPGEHADLEWDGVFSTDVALPQACVLPASGAVASPMCRRATRVAPGAYSFTLRAGASLDCGEECQPCRPRVGGGCETRSALVQSLDQEVSATVELGDGPSYGLEGPIELVFSD